MIADVLIFTAKFNLRQTRSFLSVPCFLLSMYCHRKTLSSVESIAKCGMVALFFALNMTLIILIRLLMHE